MKASIFSFNMLHNFSSWGAERDGLIFKVLYGPNSMVLTHSGLESAKHKSIGCLLWVSFTTYSKDNVLGVGLWSMCSIITSSS